jgi:hypothetical protein
MKYIFVSGAPGSKWSSVVKNIYYSPSIDSSDAAHHREYYHDASGKYQLMHMGAYWGPAMEFGNWFEQLDQYSRKHNEAEFDRPFSGSGIRIVKSHVFGYHIDYIKRTWPDCPIVLVDRSDDACLGWWVKCGEFNITYPLYRDYYLDLRQMAQCIRRENEGNRRGAREWPARTVSTNLQLARLLGIKDPPADYRQDYVSADIGVTVI